VKIIEQQHKLDFGYIMESHNKEISDKIIKEATEEIDKLAYESDKEVFSVVISKENKICSETKDCKNCELNKNCGCRE